MSSGDKVVDDIMGVEATASAAGSQQTEAEVSKSDRLPHETESHVSTVAGEPRGEPDDRDSGVELEFLVQIPWSWYHTKDCLADRVVKFEESMASREADYQAWRELGRPPCTECGRKHPPPCEPQGVREVATKGKMLGEWLAAQLAGPQPSAEAQAPTSTGKGKAVNAEEKAPSSSKEERKSSRRGGLSYDQVVKMVRDSITTPRGHRRLDAALNAYIPPSGARKGGSRKRDREDSPPRGSGSSQKGKKQ